MFSIAIFLVILISVGRHTFVLGISPMPSSPRAIRELILLVKSADSPIVELGSGWGILSYKLARAFPERQVIGYELSPVPYLFSVLIKYFFTLTNLKLVRANFLHQKIPVGAILVCYLYPGGMSEVEKKLEEYKSSSLISNTFALPNKKADKIIRLEDIYKTPIYLYDFKN